MDVKGNRKRKVVVCIAAHGKQHMLAGEGSGHHSEVRETVVGYETIHHDAEGHWERIESGGHWERDAWTFPCALQLPTAICNCSRRVAIENAGEMPYRVISASTVLMAAMSTSARRPMRPALPR